MKRLLWFLPLLFILIPVVNAGISFQPSVIDEVRVLGVEKGVYNVTYKDQWVCFTPYLVLDGKETTDLSRLNPDVGKGVDVKHVVKELDKEGRYLGSGSLGREGVGKIEWGYQVNNIPSEKSRELTECGYKIDSNLIGKYESFNEYADGTWYKIRRINYGCFTVDFSDMTYKHENVTLDKYNKKIYVKTFQPKSLDLDPITYSNPTITVIGGSEASPYTFWDLWNASNVNNWNVACQTCENNTKSMGLQNRQYYFNCTIIVGNNNDQSWLADENVQVLFDGGISGNWQKVIELKNKGHFKMGDTVGGTHDTYTCGNGGSLIFMDNYRTYIIHGAYNEASSLQLYGTHIRGANNTYQQYVGYHKNVTMYYVVFNNVELISLLNVNFYEVTLLGEDQHSAIINCGGDMENVAVRNHFRYCSFIGSGLIPNFTNLVGYDAVSVLAEIVGNKDDDGNLIDCEFDMWEFYFDSTSDGEIYRKYTFNLEVKNSTGYPLENATVALIQADLSNAFNVSTAADGTITEQTVIRGHYNQTGDDTLYDYGPHHLQVQHPDYQTAHIYNITLTEPVEWEITLPTETEASSETEYIPIIPISLILIAAIAAAYYSKN